jgi:signal recognition particle GTPase
VKEVNELLEQFKHFEKVMKKVKGLKLGKVRVVHSPMIISFTPSLTRS